MLHRPICAFNPAEVMNGFGYNNFSLFPGKQTWHRKEAEK
ncbi:hypothetical protein TFKS16_1163 [Tannerella forsythia KS16]|uniref:Uncharacterized protein n=1 Tax=Tannerella forsythia (strain ATCC 43037 / JCM 10827 / CCUG 21028 A / KCTC 5666 / FDC 338) TaxID=203275 RepID=G8UQ23_TANFA|nr:hypothetical protein BFO_0994 [Tannerella forsythia 92A2]BAR48484.1 hypothetical protein TF3313_0930 [Tannerella forsythia 3313]BAR51432.1 hypothetical protein TFKS16_1163 [Tannerella forsythia KS16]